jgi:hypothetical protein
MNRRQLFKISAILSIRRIALEPTNDGGENAGYTRSATGKRFDASVQN